MSRFGQVGIALGALGIMIALMGLFPGVTGVDETTGIGVIQVIMLLTGYGMLVFGGIIYSKFTFYLKSKSNLSQQIGVRLTLTGLLFAALTGLSDILGFGSHIRTETSDIFFGNLQGLGTIFSLTVSCFGVLLYTISGNPQISEESMSDDLATNPPRDTAEMKAVSEESKSEATQTSTE